MKLNRKSFYDFGQKKLGFLLFLGMFIISLWVFDDYGVSVDDPIQRTTGLINYDYIFLNDTFLLEWKDRDYGVAFELPLVIIEKLTTFTDLRDVYLLRHLFTHLFFLLGAYCCFLLIDFLYKNKWLATIGFFLIVLHPRLYAHSFFNTKDIPFMAMFLICFYWTALAFDKKTFRSFILLGFGIGLLINLRIMGLMLPCIVLFFLLIDAIKERKYLAHLKLSGVFLFITCLSLYLSWPFLWKAPVDNFLLAFKNMSQFRWGGVVFFDGNWSKATKLTWDYIPGWFAVTTPIMYLLGGIIGILLLIFNFIKQPLSFFSNEKRRNNLLYVVCFFAPLIAVVVFHSVLYNGWRQLYFIYPSFVLLIIYGIHVLFSSPFGKMVVATFFLAFIMMSQFMISNSGLQHVYFNAYVDSKDPEYMREHFDTDYWGLSYKQMLEYVLKNDDSPKVKVCIKGIIGQSNLHIIPYESRLRLKSVKKEEATYYLLSSIGRKGPEYEELKPFLYHSFKVGNSTVGNIYKLK